MKIMISACLLGEKCKYSGGSNYSEKAAAFVKGQSVIPICPEVLGGLPTPRMPAEIVGGIVKTKDGSSVDEAFRRGAALALEIARREKPDVIVLQSRSPSCGVKQIYDGSFTGTKIDGMGIFAAMAAEAGFTLIDAEDL